MKGAVKAVSDRKKLLDVCDMIIDLPYNQLKMLTDEIKTQYDCWCQDISQLNDIISTAALNIKEEEDEQKRGR